MSASATTTVDRAAAVRTALRSLVAERGFHGTSMSAVAERAGVAAGTIYVHYGSKDELVMATYAEIKGQLGEAAALAADPASPPEERFHSLWLAIYEHLEAEPDRASFLVQLEGSPYAGRAHEFAESGEPGALLQIVSAPDMVALVAPLEPALLYDVAIGPAVRLVASGAKVGQEELGVLAGSCWRAMTRP